jgi:hypothetical protein
MSPCEFLVTDSNHRHQNEIEESRTLFEHFLKLLFYDSTFIRCSTTTASTNLDKIIRAL